MNGGTKPTPGSKDKNTFEDGAKKGGTDPKVTDTLPSTETPGNRGGVASDDAPKK